MTFNDISKKMLIANFRRYKLFLLSNVLSIALFYCFAAIFTNQSFMDNDIVNSMISSNIYAPSILVGIFLVLFVPYSYQAFMKNRKHQYGILMTLGMSETEVLANMLFENCLIAGLSLIIGLILGTLMSFVFYFIIQHMIGISSLRWYFNPDSYQWTALLYGVTILLTLVTGVLGFMKMQLIDLMKDKFRSEKTGKSLPGLFTAGVVIVAVSILIIVLGYGYEASVMWGVAGFVLMFLGFFMVITHLESLEQYFIKLVPGYRERHILGTSFIRQHDKSRRRVGIIAAWLIGFSVFFAGFSAVIYPLLLQNAIHYSPYDLVYSQIFGKNQVENSSIENLLAQSGVSVKTVKQVNFLRNGAFILLPLSEVNKNFNSNYQIPWGKFLTVFQYDLNDSYQHDLTSPKTVGFDCGNEKLELQSAGSDVRILFNPNPTFAYNTLVLNDADYNKIASECKDYRTGSMKLYSFDDWKNSGQGIAAVQEYLLEKNQIDQSDQKYYKASSRIEAWMTAKQSAEFLIFLMFFVVALFWGASDVMIHFKIKAESEEEQRMLSGLYRIGVTTEEMLRMIRHKNIYYYMPQVIIGLFIGAFYNFTVNEFIGNGWKAAGCSLLIGLVLAALQFVVVLRYSKRELLSFGI